MELVTGAMGSLLPRLAKLVQDEYKLQKGVKKGIEGLIKELVSMQATLEEVSSVPLDKLQPSVKVWADNVRDLSYAIEDSLDSFLVRVEDQEPTKHTFLGFIKNTCRNVTKLKVRHELANAIEEIKIKAKEVKELRDKYKDVIGNPGTKEEIDPRLSALYNKASDLVGIDNAVDEIRKRLSVDDDVSEKNLKTVSIVGFGGLGKTTLAKAVYDRLIKKFDCGGFIPVGQNPDEKKVLRDILYELDKKMYGNITESNKDRRQLINELHGFLAGKRYLIVIDDVWDVPTWETIALALVDSNSGSRIITTTRIFEVADKAGGIYNIKPLSNENSKKLFYARIVGGEGRTSDNQSDEASNDFLRKCGGVPLSIITVASLLVGKRREVWSKVYNSIGFGDEKNQVVQNTRKILSFSYYDLPPHIKPCLLYLSTFPEDCIIWKNELIWLWVAEGLIVDEKRIGLFQVGESYFNQLVNKSMIQWVEPTVMENLGGCRVHDMVLDLIRKIAKEVNFTTVHDATHHMTPSSSNSTSIVRRLAVHKSSSVEHSNPGIKMEHVRSFSALLALHTDIPQLSSFKVLRVLLLTGCEFSAGVYSLEHLGKLVQLRYVGLASTGLSALPKGIGHDLKFLQILDVRSSGMQELPPSVGELSNLMCLCTSKGTVMTGGIGKMTSMEEIWLHSVDKIPNFFKELGNLTKVRVLSISLNEMDEGMQMALLESLRNLDKIERLQIYPEGDALPGGSCWDEWAPPAELREVLLAGCLLSRRPSWMDSFHVPCLSSVRLTVEEMQVQDLQILGQLLSLRYLKMVLTTNGFSLSYTIGNDEFKNLRSLDVNKVDIICGEGALPMLHDLACHATVGKQGEIALVPENMPCLQEVTYYLGYRDGNTSEEVEEAVAALTQAAHAHPNRPTLKIDDVYRVRIPGLGANSYQEEVTRATRQVALSILWELGRTVLTVGIPSNVYLISMLSTVFTNPAVLNLLSKFALQSGISLIDIKCDRWNLIDDTCVTLQDVYGTGKGGSSEDWSEMMQEMMPVVSQVLAELPEPTIESSSSAKLSAEMRALDVMLVELIRTLMVLTRDQAADSVHDEEGLKLHLSSMLPRLLVNPEICDLLLNIASQRWKTWKEWTFDLKREIKKYATNQKDLDLLCNVAVTSQFSYGLPAMMRQMMPVVSQILARGLYNCPVESLEDYNRAVHQVHRNILLELGRTVMMLTVGMSNVYLVIMLSTVVKNQAVLDLLSKLARQSGVWPSNIDLEAQGINRDINMMHDICIIVEDEHGVGKGGSSEDSSEMMQQMMPLVSQVLAELPDPTVESSNSAKMEAEASALTIMTEQLVNTVMVLTKDQRIVPGEEGLKVYLRSMLSRLFENPEVCDLLLNIASHRWKTWKEWTLDIRGAIQRSAKNQEHLDALCSHVTVKECNVEELPEMMQQMMPVVSQVLAGVLHNYPVESSENDTEAGSVACEPTLTIKLYKEEDKDLYKEEDKLAIVAGSSRATDEGGVRN